MTCDHHHDLDVEAQSATPTCTPESKFPTIPNSKFLNSDPNPIINQRCWRFPRTRYSALGIDCPTSKLPPRRPRTASRRPSLVKARPVAGPEPRPSSQNPEAAALCSRLLLGCNRSPIECRERTRWGLEEQGMPCPLAGPAFGGSSPERPSMTNLRAQRERPQRARVAGGVSVLHIPGGDRFGVRWHPPAP